MVKVGIVMKKLLGRELDFRSVLDVETDAVLCLGDSLSDYEGVLGAGIDMEVDWLTKRENTIQYSFVNGILHIIFVDEEAVSINQTDYSARFRFSDMSFDMRPSYLPEWVIDQELDMLNHITFYDRFYDSRGEDVIDHEEADYIATVTYWPGDGISSLNISRAELWGYED